MHKEILADAAGNAVIVGSTGKSHTFGGGNDNSFIKGVIEISAEASYQIMHRCNVTKADVGFGNPANFGVDEVYTQVKIVKVK